MGWNKNTIVSQTIEGGMPYAVVTGNGLNDDCGSQYFLRYSANEAEVMERTSDCDSDDTITVIGCFLEKVCPECYLFDPDYETEPVPEKYVELKPLAGPFYIVGQPGKVSRYVHFRKDGAENECKRLTMKYSSAFQVKELSLSELRANIIRCEFRYAWESVASQRLEKFCSPAA